MSDRWTEILAACASALHGGALSEWLPVSHPLGMLLLGLVGGAVHCSGMCGPFVLVQVGNRLATLPVAQGTMMRRLSGAALLPYHAGRATTYSLLGGAAAGIAGGLQSISLSGYLPAAALGLAALLMAVLALRQYQPAAATRSQVFAAGWTSRLAPIFGQATGLGGYMLGIALGFLPCGLLYSALLLAGAAGSWQAGMTGMLLFSIGTMPALLVVGMFGAAAGQRWRNAMRRLLLPVFALNVLILLVLALRWLPAA
ncbi:MAG: sulfite exporter TauE/SafE family protein [Alphaproteobacteria bacterium]|nr:sulfite exporter TauE/SafE family protein [Alphaproteobacteria bacterium]